MSNTRSKAERCARMSVPQATVTVMMLWLGIILQCCSVPKSAPIQRDAGIDAVQNGESDGVPWTERKGYRFHIGKVELMQTRKDTGKSHGAIGLWGWVEATTGSGAFRILESSYISEMVDEDGRVILTQERPSEATELRDSGMAGFLIAPPASVGVDLPIRPLREDVTRIPQKLTRIAGQLHVLTATKVGRIAVKPGTSSAEGSNEGVKVRARPGGKSGEGQRWTVEYEIRNNVEKYEPRDPPLIIGCEGIDEHGRIHELTMLQREQRPIWSEERTLSGRFDAVLGRRRLERIETLEVVIATRTERVEIPFELRDVTLLETRSDDIREAESADGAIDNTNGEWTVSLNSVTSRAMRSFSKQNDIQSLSVEARVTAPKEVKNWGYETAIDMQELTDDAGRDVRSQKLAMPQQRGAVPWLVWGAPPIALSGKGAQYETGMCGHLPTYLGRLSGVVKAYEVIEQTTNDLDMTGVETQNLGGGVEATFKTRMVRSRQFLEEFMVRTPVQRDAAGGLVSPQFLGASLVYKDGRNIPLTQSKLIERMHGEVREIRGILPLLQIDNPQLPLLRIEIAGKLKFVPLRFDYTNFQLVPEKQAVQSATSASKEPPAQG